MKFYFAPVMAPKIHQLSMHLDVLDGFSNELCERMCCPHDPVQLWSSNDNVLLRQIPPFANCNGIVVIGHFALLCWLKTVHFAHPPKVLLLAMDSPVGQ